MKNPLERLLNTAAITASIVGIFSSTATAATTTQVAAGAFPNFLDDANWQGGAAPVSGTDSAVLNSNNSYRSGPSTWTLGSGQSLTYTFSSTAGGSKRLFVDAGFELILATGSTLDFIDGANTMGLAINEGLTIEAGATVTTGRYQANAGGTTTWIADASGLTNYNAGATQLNATHTAVFDLSLYDLSNGTDLVFLTGNETGTFGDVQILGGYTADVDYGFNGNTQIALTNITAVPEPSSIVALSCLGVVGLLIRRR